MPERQPGSQLLIYILAVLATLLYFGQSFIQTLSMENQSSATRILEIKDSFLSGSITAEQLILQLKDAGLDAAAINQWITDLTREHKRELFNKAVRRDDNNEIRGVVFFITLLISIIGPVFDIRSPFWYIIALLAVAIAGYYGFKEKPIAGIAGTVAFGILFPLAYAQYFANKTSYIRIEMLFPIAMAAIPAFLLLFILSKTIYRGQD